MQQVYNIGMIYCVEDEMITCDLMVYTLNNSGFKVKGFCDSTEFERAMKEELPELIVLDVMLPGKNGLDILKELRQRSDTRNIPVILATAMGSEIDKVQGLDLGADSYLTKPFGMMELTATVRAVLRRSSGSKTATITQGNVEINPDERKVTVGGKPVVLTFKEFEILQMFMNNPGTAFFREHIIESIWGIEYMGETRTVDVHVGTLRAKLKLAGSEGVHIRTLRSVGYKLEVE